MGNLRLTKIDQARLPAAALRAMINDHLSDSAIGRTVGMHYTRVKALRTLYGIQSSKFNRCASVTRAQTSGLRQLVTVAPATAMAGVCFTEDPRAAWADRAGPLPRRPDPSVGGGSFADNELW